MEHTITKDIRSMLRDNTVEQNLSAWDAEHSWAAHGEEWSGQASFCGRDYEEWKRSLVDCLIRPHAREADVLEIAPGHGRWSAELLESCRSAWLVDLSPACLDYCHERFSGASNVSYYRTDGSSLPQEIAGQVDFVWSYDSFVHMSGAVISHYLQEMARVLKPGGHAVIHHAGRRHWTLPLGFLRVRAFGGFGRLAYRRISMGFDERHDGWRSNVSARRFARSAERAGLVVERQLNEWAPGFGIPRYRDVITVLRKPA